ncbi:MAG: hypothetical protein ACJ8FU_08280 [Xanthobacteraceae bacterium]
MVAYSFQPCFVQPILDGAKRQTIRADRRRHARPGEELQLYTGMRTKHCKLIARKTCLNVLPVMLWLMDGKVFIGGALGTYYGDGFDKTLDSFARLDGFSSWTELTAFWAKHFPGANKFSGVLITWEAARSFRRGSPDDG